MRRLLWIARGIVNSVRGTRLDREMSDEFAFHLDSRAADLVRAGLSVEEAKRQAYLEFGSVERYKEHTREARDASRLEALARDVAYAWRGLRRAPLLLLSAVLSLGLGIGVNIALFTVINGVLLQRPTVADPDRVVGVRPGGSDRFSYLNYRDLLDSRIFAGLAGSGLRRLNLRSADTIESVNALIVTANFFDVLGVGAGFGRIFVADEAAPEREPRLAVLSHGYWQRRFNGDLGLLGQPLNLNGDLFTVIGILPRAYRPVTGVLAPDVYVPLSASAFPPIGNWTNVAGLEVVGRLHPDVTRQQAQAAVTEWARELERRYPEENEGLGRPASVFALRGALLGRAPREIVVFATMLSILFALVLLIACGNVAGLLIARATVRQRELALRTALGASRARLIQGLLAESVLLAVLGAGAGLLFSLIVLPTLSVVTLPGQAPIQLSLRPDLVLYAYSVGVALATGLMCGILPALRATRQDFVGDLRQGTGVGTTGRLRARHAFVVAQVAASLTLLIVSSLFARSLIHIATLDPGFDVDQGIVATLRLEEGRYSRERANAVVQAALDRVAAMPGVRSASVATMVPLSGNEVATRFPVEGQPDVRIRTFINHVGPHYFQTMGIPMLRGRDFETSDREGAPRVAIVNEAFVTAFFVGREVLGSPLADSGQERLKGETEVQYSEIVGVVRDSKFGSISEKPTPIIYYAFAQHDARSRRGGNPVVHVRTDGAAEAAVGSVRRSILEVDRTLAVDIQTLRHATDFGASIRRIGSLLLGSLGLLGVMLATIGLYGVMAFVVASRTSEIGVRMALGASPMRMLGDVLLQGSKIVTLGAVIGIALALVVTRPLAAFLAGLSPGDPIAFGGAAAALIITGLAASYIPARRATRVDPCQALRQE